MGEKEKAGGGRPGRASNTAGIKDYTGKRNKRDVWFLNTSHNKDEHFATFPIELVTPCILAGSPEGGVVMDIFNGSGTTGVAAMNNGREYIGIDLNPDYIDMSENRFEREVLLCYRI